MEASQNLPATSAKEKARSLMAVLEARKDAFKDLLPKYLTTEKLFRVAQMAFSKQPLLLQCTPASFVIAMMDAARSGLEPDGKQAALVPYGKEMQFQPMYQGMVKQAIVAGAAKKISARLVHANDKFKIKYDPEPHIEHEPALEDEGEVIGAYAYAVLPDGDLQLEWMNRRQLDIIKNKAKSKSGPWLTDTEEMYRKTPTKRLFKYLPIPESLEYAVQVDNALETGRSRIDVPLLEPAPEPPKEGLKERLKGRGRPPKTDDPTTTTTAPHSVGFTEQSAPTALDPEEIQEIFQYAGQAGKTVKEICDKYGVSGIEEMDRKTGNECLGWLMDCVAEKQE